MAYFVVDNLNTELKKNYNDILREHNELGSTLKYNLMVKLFNFNTMISYHKRLRLSQKFNPNSSTIFQEYIYLISHPYTFTTIKVFVILTNEITN